VPLSTGSNAFGQLGDASVSTRRTTPAPIDVPQMVAVASGRDHAYGLDAAGRVWSWGENGYGQVGDGTTTDRRTPVRLALTDVVAIEAGPYHGVAVRSDGSGLGIDLVGDVPTPAKVRAIAAVAGLPENAIEYTPFNAVVPAPATKG
jgi:alpha-tubulin suppressor-like RCC1 family protein